MTDLDKRQRTPTCSVHETHVGASPAATSSPDGVDNRPGHGPVTEFSDSLHDDGLLHASGVDSFH